MVAGAWAPTPPAAAGWRRRAAVKPHAILADLGREANVPEKAIVRQNSQYETEFQIPDPEDPESGEYVSIAHLHALTPFGMMLVSVGTCTTILLHSYAQNHGIPLDEVQIDLEYSRDFHPGSEEASREGYDEQISQQIHLYGDLDRETRHKLFAISHHCSIEKILENGIDIESSLAEAL
jgi:uncharacterized OsmC-like protein